MAEGKVEEAWKRGQGEGYKPGKRDGKAEE